MRTISISTDVFARIWALRQDGEDSEDAVLRRVLGCEDEQPLSSDISSKGPSGGGAIVDRRFGVEFPRGFEIFRTYLGHDYRARVASGRWELLGHGRHCATLNDLSRTIGAKTENAWINWFYIDQSGQRRPVADLRDPTRVVPRKHAPKNAHLVQSGSSSNHHNSDVTWRDDTVTALQHLGRKASLQQIYATVEAIRKASGRSIPRTLDAVVRRTLEDHSSDSDNYRGGPDLFHLAEGKGAGVWALR